MVATKKDSRQWVFDEKEELPLEWINGIFSYIETGDTLFKTSLPTDYKNSQFPTTNEKILCKRSKIGLEGNFRNNQTNIGLDSGGNIKLWIYPNIAPFKGFNSIVIKATNGVQLRLILRNFTGNILYNQAITVTNNKATFDLSNIEIGQLKDLKYCSIEILTNITNTTIENIDINYDLRDEKLTELFKNLVKPNQVVNITHPPGTIYKNKLDDMDPNTHWPGTEWEKIEEKFLFGASVNYPIGTTGGEARVTLTTANLPNHNHNVSIAGSGTLTTSNNTHNHNSFAKIRGLGSGSFDIRENVSSSGADESKTTSSDTHNHTVGSHGHTVSQTSVGSNESHNNMPPFEVVNIWARVN